MKIAFVGKGGAGKTTLAALFARHLAEQHKAVLTIDADINQHLAEALGMTRDQASIIPPLGLGIERLKEYLRGTNYRVPDNRSMIKTTPPGPGSRFLKINEKNSVYDHFAKEIGGIRLLAVGSFGEEDIGTKCYHSKTGSAELVLNHLVDKEQEYVLVDMTAGADSFASGIFTRFDMTFLVVEPTIKSVGVYEQYQRYAKDYDVAVKVIGNKIENQDDIDFLKKHVDDDLISVMWHSRFVKMTDRGEFAPMALLEEDNKMALKKMKAAVDGQKKDWIKFYRQNAEFHIKNAKGWANDDVGKDLTDQIVPSFLEQLARSSAASA